MNSEKLIVAFIGLVTLGIFSFIAYTSFKTPVLSDLTLEQVIGSQPHTLGANVNEAKLVLVEFSDFECPYCAQVEPVLVNLVETTPEMALVYRHFPIPGHRYAQLAARASEAAANQGKFWEMVSELFKISPDLTEENIKMLAKDLGLNEEQFANDLNSQETTDKVVEDSNMSKTLNLNGTPSFYVVQDGKFEKLDITSINSIEDEVRRRLGLSEPQSQPDSTSETGVELEPVSEPETQIEIESVPVTE
ncbi:MAG: hypothetical protein QG570_344 [Patescibacteria group bacterium]|nr:hypothetical protein [Patescibacteria group bacterium]